jgi:hypothetical protein
MLWRLRPVATIIELAWELLNLVGDLRKQKQKTARNRHSESG